MTDAPLGPAARRTTPAPPSGDHDLTIITDVPSAVVVDTNTLLDGSYLAPLSVSARYRDLAVFWSSAIARQMVKVVYRGNVLAALRRPTADDAGRSMASTLRAVFDRIAEGLDDQLAELERTFRSATNLDAVEEALLDVLSDVGDRPVLRTALAAEAPYLLSLDQRHFPHGAVFYGVQCWHPDSFLTLFYQQNPAAHERAADGVRRVPASIRRRLLP